MEPAVQSPDASSSGGALAPNAAPALAWAPRAAAVLLLAAIALALTTAVVDPDFWWHLASGRWIWENHALPARDPFGTGLDFGEGPGRAAFVLRQFWLAQLLFHGVHALAGPHGIVLLRTAILGAMFALAYRRLRGLGAPVALAAALTGLVAQVVIVEVAYVADRPQLFTSLFLVVLLEALDRSWRGDRRAQWALPALMALWANLHGGFVVGAGVAAVYALARLPSIREGKRPFVFVAAAVLAGGLNPSGFEAAFQAFGTSVAEQSPYWRQIVEWQSLFDHATAAGIARRLPALAALAGLGLAGAIAHAARPRAMRAERLALALLATAMGVRAIRFVPFFAVVAAETVALGLGPLAARAAHGVRTRWPRQWAAASSAVAAVAVLAVAGHFALLGWRTTALAEERPYDASLEPAVHFIRANGLRGVLFGDHDDGGFLVNALAPTVRPFIDGRALSIRAFDLYRQAVDAPQTASPFAPGIPAYRALLAVSDAELVLLPGADPVSGTLVRMTEVLLRDPDWAVVYADARVVLFARRRGTLAGFAQERKLPPSAGYENMLALAARASRGPGHARMMPGWMLSAAVALARTGRAAQAVGLLARYQRAVPNDPFAVALGIEIARGHGR
jgi:hypothetical protein